MIARRTLLAGSAALPALAAPRLAAQARGRVLRFVPQSDLGVVDPVFSAAYVTRNHALAIYDTLYGMDAAHRIHPQMAEGHLVDADGLAWTIRLREGLRFHDGEPVLARDAAASIRRWGARDGLGSSLLAATEALDAPDDRTLRFRLKHPFPLLAYALGKPSSPVCVVMPERMAATDPYRQVTDLTGSGPFRFNAAETVAGARVVYERNEAYVPRPDGVPSFTAGPKHAHFDRVEWHVLPDPSTAAAALRAGEVDWYENPAFDLVPSLQRDGRVSVTVPDPTGSIAVMRFNHLVPPFDNPALRRAVLLGVKQSDFVGAVAGEVADGWRDGVGVFAPGTPLANDEGLSVLTGPRSLDTVRRAVAASGYRGERVVLIAPGDFPSLKTLGEVGADLLKRLGMNVDYQAADWATMRQRLANRGPVESGGWSVFHTFWAGLDHMDPAVHLYVRGNGAAASPGWPTSERLEALRAEWLRAGNDGERLRLARAIQAQVFQDVPYIPLGQTLQRTAFRREITGVLPGFAIFWNVRRA